MKSIYLIAFLMTSILPPPEVASARMIVFKDCTGWYLREGNRDYRICNYDMVKDYEHKGAVEVSYQRISSCDIRGGRTACRKLHKHFGWVKVTKIR